MFDLYQQFVRERHRAWARRQAGELAPWSNDPIIANHKFTNDYRLLDRGSQFLIKDLLDPDADALDVLARCFLYRVTNLPKTWQYLRSAYGGRYPIAADMNDELINFIQGYRALGNTVFSGAYMIVPQPGKAGDKVQHAVELARTFLDHHAENFFAAETQIERFEILAAPYGMGRFLAMQVLTDWGYSSQCGIDYENEFVVDGPGARRGAHLIEPSQHPVELIHNLKKIWLHDEVVQLRGRPLSLMDVQNTLCEFMKYARYKAKGDVGKAFYAGHGPMPEPIIPHHFITASE